MNSDENPSLTSDSPRFDADDLGTPDSVESSPTANSEVYEDVPDDEPVGETSAATETTTETLTAEMLNEDVSDLADDVEELSDEVNQFAVSAVAATDAPEESIDTELSPELLALQQPFVGQWNGLVSTTNWEKGRIISQWRAALIEAGAPSTEYSDEAWASRVGGVTAPHVGVCVVSSTDSRKTNLSTKVCIGRTSWLHWIGMMRPYGCKEPWRRSGRYRTCETNVGKPTVKSNRSVRRPAKSWKWIWMRTSPK